MKNNKVKFIIVFTLAICLSFIHVHCSINIQDNPLNPLTLILMLIATSYDGNIIYEMIASYSIQFIVTSIIASVILKFKNMIIWLLSYVIVIMLCIYIGTNYGNILHSFEGLSISKLYEDFYGFESAFSTAAIGMSLQFLVLITYISLTYIYADILIGKYLLRSK